MDDSAKLDQLAEQPHRPNRFADKRIGLVIEDKYKILAVLGEGNYGRVYKVVQDGFDRTSAMKILQDPGDPDSLARFRREAKILSHLDHRNIPRVYSFGISDGKPYIVMEYIQGRTLAQILEAGALPWTEVVQFGIQICQGMAAAHEQGIVHRDINPRNIVLADEADGRCVKILDFGLAGFFEGNVSHSQAFTMRRQKLTQTGAIVGTIYYMSPEICTGHKADNRSDIYSVGCVLYECLSGKKPFDADSPIVLLHNHVSQMPGRLRETAANIPEQLERVIFKAMQKDPQARFPSMANFADALMSVQEGNFDALDLSHVQLTMPASGRRTSSSRSDGGHRVGPTRRAVAALAIAGTLMLALLALQYSRISTAPRPDHELQQLREQDYELGQLHKRDYESLQRRQQNYESAEVVRKRQEWLERVKSHTLDSEISTRTDSNSKETSDSFADQWLSAVTAAEQSGHRRTALITVHRMVSELISSHGDDEAADVMDRVLDSAQATRKHYYITGVLLEYARWANSANHTPPSRLTPLNDQFCKSTRALIAPYIEEGAHWHWTESSPPGKVYDAMQKIRDAFTNYFFEKQDYDSTAELCAEWNSYLAGIDGEIPWITTRHISKMYAEAMDRLQARGGKVKPHPWFR